MPRRYVKNAMNRRLGRVGKPRGSMPHSSSGSGGSSGYYVDNAMNRRLGRVGMPHGSMPHFRSDNGSSSGLISLLFDFGMSSFGSTSYKTSRVGEMCADNEHNRRVGRAYLPMGLMPISKSYNVFNFDAPTSTRSASSYAPGEDSYVNNAVNQRLGRDGMPHGSMPHSSQVKRAPANPKAITKTYVDNDFNRRHGAITTTT